MEGIATSIFNVPSLRFERAVTERIPPGPGRGDVLIAEWSIHEAFGRGSLILTDTPYYSDYTLRLADCKIASQADLTNFLHALMAPPGGRTAAPAATPSRPPNFELPPTNVSIDEDIPRSPAFAGSRLGTQSASFLADFEFAGVRQGKEWYLHFGVGKSYRSYPFTAPPATAGLLVGSAYIPERFPLLADLIKSWSSGQIRKEVGRTVESLNGVVFTTHRDQVLIAELARRGLTSDQIADLVTDVAPSPENYNSRLTSVASGYRDAGKGSFADIFEPALEAYEHVGPGAEAAVFSLFGRAQSLRCSSAIEERALGLLKAGVFLRGPMGYLGRCSTSPATIAVVEKIDSPNEDVERTRMAAITVIRRRIANPRMYPAPKR